MSSAEQSMEGGQRAQEKLEVEDEEQRQRRIHELFSRLNAQGSASASVASASFDFGDRHTFAMEPPLELLSRVQAFLPELAASNADLLRRAREDPASVDIESLNEDQLQYIEMNLGVGVFEHRGTSAHLPPGIPVADVDLDLDGAAQSDSDGDSDEDEDENENEDVDMDDSSTSEDSDSSSSSTSKSKSDPSSKSSDSDSSDADSDSDSDSDADADVASTTRPIKPLPKRRPTAASASMPSPAAPSAPAPAPLTSVAPPARSEREPKIVVLSENNEHNSAAPGSEGS